MPPIEKQTIEVVEKAWESKSDSNFIEVSLQNSSMLLKNLYNVYVLYTVETELVAAAPIKFDEILVQNLLSKNHILLKGAALIKVRPLIPFLR